MAKLYLKEGQKSGEIFIDAHQKTRVIFITLQSPLHKQGQFEYWQIILLIIRHNRYNISQRLLQIATLVHHTVSKDH